MAIRKLLAVSLLLVFSGLARAVCPEPTVVDWGELYGSSRLVISAGAVTFVEPCYTTIRSTDGQSRRFLTGELGPAAPLLNQLITVQYDTQTLTVGYMRF